MKIHWRNKQIFSSRTTESISNLAQNILGWRGFKFVKMKGRALFQGEIITQYWKIQRWNLKLFSHVRDVAHGPIVFHFFILVFVSILSIVLIMIDWFLLLHDLKTKLPSSYLSLLYAELLYTCTRYIELSLRYNRI